MAILLLLLFLHGIFLSALLAFHEKRGSQANLYLSALLLVASLLLLESYLGASGVTSRWPHLRGIFQPAWFLIGPLCCLYILRFLGRQPSRRDLLLFLPAVGVGLWMLPYFRLSAATKAGRETYVDATVSTLVIYFAFSALTAACAWVAYRQVEATELGREDGAHTPPPWRLGWLGWLMGALAAYAVLDFVASLIFITLGSYPAVLGYISLLILTSLIYGAGLLVVIPDGLLARTPWPKKNYGRSEIPADKAAEELATLDRVMESEKLWLDEDLTLDGLASRLGVSRHHLSQLMNQHLGSTFHDYVNRYRVEEAKRLLLDMGSRRSILDIGFSAGFGSSASFYRVFKKQVGASPREFLAGTAGADADRFETGKR